MKTVKNIIILLILSSISTFGILSIDSPNFNLEKNVITRKIKIINSTNAIYAGELNVTHEKEVSDDFILSEFLILLQPFEEKEVIIQYVGGIDFEVEKTYQLNLDTVPLLAKTTYKKNKNGRDSKISVVSSFGKKLYVIKKEDYENLKTEIKINNMTAKIIITNKGNSIFLKSKKIALFDKKELLEKKEITLSPLLNNEKEIIEFQLKKSFEEKDLSVKLY